MLPTLSSLVTILVSSYCFTFLDSSVAAVIHLVSIGLYRVTHEVVLDKLLSNLLQLKCSLGCPHLKTLCLCSRQIAVLQFCLFTSF